MHELPVTQGILRIAAEEAAKHNAKRVSLIKVKVGLLTSILPECINYYFEILSKGTVAEGAVIEVEKLPLKVKCNNCGVLSEIEPKSFRCPECSSQDLTIVQGNEFYVDSLEVE